MPYYFKGIGKELAFLIVAIIASFIGYMINAIGIGFVCFLIFSVFVSFGATKLGSTKKID